MFLRPHLFPPVAQGVVVGAQGGSILGSSPALTVDPASTRVASLTHAVHPGIYPQGALASFYPDFLRKRNTPAMHYVAAEEVGKDLPMSAQEPTGVVR